MKKKLYGIMIFCLSIVVFQFCPIRGEASSELCNPVSNDVVSVWNSVYFGNYISSSAVTDKTLISKLKKAKYVNDITEINGKKYRRETGRIYNESTGKTGNGYYYFPYEKLKWRVLWTDGTKALLLTNQVVEKQKFHLVSSKKVEWKNCTLRGYLNGYGSEQNLLKMDFTEKNFLDKAFTEKEQEMLISKKTTKNTADKVFLLTVSDMKKKAYGFINDDSRDGNADWWLQNTGSTKGTAAYVYYRGALHPEGYQVDSQHDRVRPAVLVDLTKGKLVFAGCVTSKNEAIPSSYGTHAGEALTRGCVISEIRNLKNRTFDLKWKKLTNQAEYQIYFSANNSFRDVKKTIVRKNNYRCRLPKSGKKYYIKIRVILKSGKKKIYGNWSKILTLKG